MKRLLLAILWILLATTVHAQRRKALPPAPLLDVPVVYCVLIVVDPGPLVLTVEQFEKWFRK